MTQQQILQQTTLITAYTTYQKALNTYAFFKVSDKTTSEDLVQDTFIKTWSYLVKGGEIQTMKAFLYHILNNLIIDEYRKNKPTSLDVLLEKGFEPSIDISDRMVNVLDAKSAVLLISQLPKTYQKVMSMRYVQDMSLEEMSRTTGQTKNTIAVQLHRGLVQLKKIYLEKQPVQLM